MVDMFTKEQRGALMRKMRATNGVAESLIFELLQQRCLPFEKHGSALPGRPDVVFDRRRLAVFIDGDFFHGRSFERWKYKLSPFWLNKISGNIRRDRRVNQRLWNAGWSVLHLWTKDVERDPERSVARILRAHSRRSATRKKG